MRGLSITLKTTIVLQCKLYRKSDIAAALNLCGVESSLTEFSSDHSFICEIEKLSTKQDELFRNLLEGCEIKED